MNKNEIKTANRKALPKFIFFIILSMIVGGLFGFFSAKYGLSLLSDSIKSAGVFFGTHIASYMLLAVAVAVPVISAPLYVKAKKILRNWDGEDEEIYDAADKKLSVVLWVTGVSLIFSFFLLSASYSAFSKENRITVLVGIASFFIILLESVLIQQKCIDAVKAMNPEKTASVYDTKFQKKWLDSCDEAEKAMIGKCAFKAYSATNTICLILSVALAVCALEFPIGFLPSLIVCLIWLVNQSAYLKEAMKYSKAGSKIS